MCWREEALTCASVAGNVHEACTALSKAVLKDESITAAFEQVEREKVTYSHRQHTSAEARCVVTKYTITILTNYMYDSAEIVRWVAESMRPFNIVNDHGCQSLMKTGRPDYYIPSPSTVSHDVKRVFVRCCERIAEMLQVCEQA